MISRSSLVISASLDCAYTTMFEVGRGAPVLARRKREGHTAAWPSSLDVGFTQPRAWFTALTTAFREAAVMLGSMPTPQIRAPWPSAIST